MLAYWVSNRKYDTFPLGKQQVREVIRRIAIRKAIFRTPGLENRKNGGWAGSPVAGRRPRSLIGVAPKSAKLLSLHAAVRQSEYTKGSMKIEALLTEAEISQEFAEAIEARDIPEKFFYWHPLSVRSWLALSQDVAYESRLHSWNLLVDDVETISSHF